MLVGLALGALAGVLGAGLVRWIGVAVLMFCAPPVLAPALRHPKLCEILRRHGPKLAFGALFLLLCGELLLGRPPATRDHGIHYFQTHLLVHDMLPAGRLHGWSPRLNHGYPYGDSYPVLGYLLMAAMHLLSVGLVSLRTSYAWGIAALWLGSALAVWWLAQSVARELHPRPTGASAKGPFDPSAWAGAAAASAWLLDPGAARQGGWNYLMFHGVWPQQLSTALWVASIPLTLALWRGPTPRRIGLLGLCVGASVMAHPFGLITAAFGAVSLPLVFLVAEGRAAWPPGALRAHLIAHLLGGMICAGTVVVFLASADYMGRSPVPWLSWPELAAELVTGEPFRAQRALVGALALLGAAASLRRGRAAAWATLSAVIGMALLASQASVVELGLDLLVSAFKNLQFPRFSIALKPLWFALAGVGVSTLLHALGRRDGEGRPRPAPGPAAPAWVRLVACVALAPLLTGALEGLRDAVPRPVGALHTLEGSHHGPHERALHAALRREADAAEGRLRVAFLRRDMSGGTYPLFAIADVDADLAMDAHIPSVNFVYRLDHRRPAALDALGVTHVIHDRPLPERDAALEARLEAIGRFGDFRLARMRPPPERSRTRGRGGGILRPEAPARLDPNGGFEIEVPAEALEGRPRVRVELPIAPYRTWEATGPDGAPAPIRARRGYERSLVGIAVTVATPGRLRIEQVEPPLERFAAWLSLLAALLAGAASMWGHPTRWRPRLREGPWPGRVALGLAATGTLAGALVVPIWQSHKLARSWGPLIEARAPGRGGVDRDAPRPNFVRDPVYDRSARVWLPHEDRCDGMLTKDARAGCSDRAESPHRAMLYRRPYLYRCLSVTVPGRASARVSVDGIAGDHRLHGVVERVTQGRGGDGLTLHLPPDPRPAVAATGAETVPGETERPGQALTRQRVFGDLAPDPEGVTTVELRNAHPDPQTACLALAVATAAGEPPR